MEKENNSAMRSYNTNSHFFLCHFPRLSCFLKTKTRAPSPCEYFHLLKEDSQSRHYSMAKLVQKLVALLLKTFLEGLRCPAALIFIPPKQSKTHILLCSSRQIQKWDWVKNEHQTLASVIPTALRLGRLWEWSSTP